MKILTKHSDYAIRALLSLGAAEGRYLSARAVSLEQDIPYQFLRRILQELIRHGLVHSREGAQGGFSIARDPDAIRVMQLIEIFQGPVQVSDCMFRKQVCSNRSRCVLRHELVRIERTVREEFEKITIGSLLRDLETLNAAGGSGCFPAAQLSGGASGSEREEMGENGKKRKSAKQP